jgi:alkylhydroperoxidase/carboxymuconolactone decarboxylase family protein YurZ
MPSDPEQVLRRLASGDEHFLTAVMTPTPEFGLPDPAAGEPLDRRTRTLVRLAALLALSAPTSSLQWAAELAATNGAGDDAITAVLLAAARAAGSARVVESAPRLAVALGFDVELDRWDGT